LLPSFGKQRQAKGTDRSFRPGDDVPTITMAGKTRGTPSAQPKRGLRIPLESSERNRINRTGE
jgi:hypothetical protein